MEFEKLRDIIVEVLNVDETEVTMESTFIDDLGADSLDVFQLSWVSRKSSISRFLMRKQRKSSL